MKTKNLTIRLHEEDRKLLREIACVNETSCAEMVRRWALDEMQKYLNEKNKK